MPPRTERPRSVLLAMPNPEDTDDWKPTLNRETQARIEMLLREGRAATSECDADDNASGRVPFWRRLVCGRKPHAAEQLDQPHHDEYQYLRLVARILRDGDVQPTRTGTRAVMLFGQHMRFSLRDMTVPLLTTKSMWWRGIVAELLWFIRGCTNANELSRQKVHIWDANSSRAFLDAAGFAEREVGDLGPVYGFQWRHFGAEYTDMRADYTAQGIDQLACIIRTLRQHPSSRRMVMSAWNPKDIPRMALPPCHCLAQFHAHRGQLSCQLYQRSADVGLGLPFNIASYSLLTHLVAHVVGMRAKELVVVLGNAHVYQNHVFPLSEQLQRSPRAFPRLQFTRTVAEIDDFTPDDFVLRSYNPHAAIPMKLSV